MSAIDHKTRPISINLSFRVWKKLILPIDIIDVFEPNVGRLLLKKYDQAGQLCCLLRDQNLKT